MKSWGSKLTAASRNSEMIRKKVGVDAPLGSKLDSKFSHVLFVVLFTLQTLLSTALMHILFRR